MSSNATIDQKVAFMIITLENILSFVTQRYQALINSDTNIESPLHKSTKESLFQEQARLRELNAYLNEVNASKDILLRWSNLNSERLTKTVDQVSVMIQELDYLYNQLTEDLSIFTENHRQHVDKVSQLTDSLNVLSKEKQ